MPETQPVGEEERFDPAGHLNIKHSALLRLLQAQVDVGPQPAGDLLPEELPYRDPVRVEPSEDFIGHPASGERMVVPGLSVQPPVESLRLQDPPDMILLNIGSQQTLPGH